MPSLYEQRQEVSITDPSATLVSAGLSNNTFNFPFTPNITVLQSSAYSEYSLTHTNFQQRAFDMSSNAELTLVAPVIVRSDEEAESVIKGAQFFRAAMKMTFANDPNPGLPPPVLRLNAYNLYKNVPVLIRDFTWNLENNIDYVTTASGERLPKVSNFVLSLSTTYGTDKIRQEFSVRDFASGRLRDKGYI